MESEVNLPNLEQKEEKVSDQFLVRKDRSQYFVVGLVLVAIVLFLSLAVFKRDRDSLTSKVYVAPTKTITNNNPTTYQGVEIPTLTPAPAKVLVKLNGYQLEDFNLAQSPFCGQFFKDCINICGEYRDLRLIDNQLREVIPSLMQLIYQNPNPNNLHCAISPKVSLFSSPIGGNYIYLATATGLPIDAPYSGIDNIFRLNYLTKETYKLKSSEYIRHTDLYRGIAFDSYKLLPDGKRLIKWNMSEVSVVNLESDKIDKLYTSASDEWLISSIEFGMGQTASYDVQVSDSELTIGLYSKKLTEDNKKMTVDEFDNVEVEDGSREDIKPKFIRRVRLSIPN